MSADRACAPALAVTDANIGRGDLSGLLPSPDGFAADAISSCKVAPPQHAFGVGSGIGVGHSLYLVSGP